MSVLALGKAYSRARKSGSFKEGLGDFVFGGALPYELRFRKFGQIAKDGEVLKKAGLAAALGRSAHAGWENGPFQTIKGVPVNLLMAGMVWAGAKRGHKLSSAAGSLLSGLGGAAAAMLLGPVAGLAAGFFLDNTISEGITAGIQALADRDVTRHSLGMGGGFHDTQRAYTMRMAAAQEMSGSLMNARQFLGHEGRLMHS